MIDDDIARLPTPQPRRPFISAAEIWVMIIISVIALGALASSFAFSAPTAPSKKLVEVGPSEYLDLRLTLLTAPQIKPHIRVVLRDGKVTYNEYHALKVIQHRLIKRELLTEATTK